MYKEGRYRQVHNRGAILNPMIKRLLQILKIAAFVVIGGAICWAVSQYVQYRTGASSLPNASVVACQRHGVQHQVLIRDGQLSAVETDARLCDTLTITNEDSRLRLIAFGPHDHHLPYDGVVEKLLDQRQSLTITLDQAGRYSFHDHLEENIVGYFTVSR